jgi:VanZ family protein
MYSTKVTFSRNGLFRWLPAALMMLAIFLYSAGQALDMPQSGLRLLVNKSGHVIGYAMLALSYWRAFNFNTNKRWAAWLLAVLYAMTDEFHQSFVPGRYSSLFDVLVYDNLGACFAMLLAGLFLKQKQPVLQRMVVEDKSVTAKHR